MRRARTAAPTPDDVVGEPPQTSRARKPKPDIALRDLGFPALLPLWLVGGYVIWYVLARYPSLGLANADSHGYWLTAHRDSLYSIAPGSHDAFVYSPAFAQLIYPIAVLPWRAFAVIWATIEAAAFAWLWAPLGWRWAVPLTAICAIEIGIGNIYGVLAVCLVLGLRHPAAVAVPLLTKITPAVGLVWFAVRAEWRRLALALGITAAVAAASFALDHTAWRQWIDYLIDNRGSDASVPYHVAAGLLVAAYAARKDKAWLLAPAALLACPIIHGWLPITILAAIPRLREDASA